MSAVVVNISDLYFARSKILNWRMKVARNAGRYDDANDYALLAWEAERIAINIRARGGFGLVNGSAA